MPTLDDRWTRTLMAVLSHLALLLVWYLFVRFGDVPKFVMPSPVDTAATLFGPRAGGYNWWSNTAVTATEIFGATPSRSSSACCSRSLSPGPSRSRR